jgi:hypothetical protein
MQYGTPSSRLCARAKPNTEPSKSSASNLIGAEKRHSVRVSCARSRAGGGRRTGHVRRAPVEDRSRMAGEGLPRLPAFGFPTLSRSGARLQPLLYTGQPGAKRRKQALSILEPPEGSVDCVHQFRRPLLRSQERLSLQAPCRSRHPTLWHCRLTRTRRDRSRYPGQMSRRWLTTRRRAATPRNLRGRLVPLTTISVCRLPHLEQTSRSRQSSAGVSVPCRAAISAGSGSTC